MLNITQHVATPVQVSQGVVEPSPEFKTELQKLITFDRSVIEQPEIIGVRSQAVVQLIKVHYPDTQRVMVGGALFMMPSLVNELKEAGIEPLFAYSDRVSVDVHNPDGTVTKTVKFEHLGFVRA